MRYLLLVRLLLLLPAAPNAFALEGKYRLVSEADVNGTDVPLPEGRFKLKVASDGNSSDTYRFSYRIGNSISATVAVQPDHSATFSDIVSTKMLPTKDIYLLETDLTSIMLSSDATVERTGRILVIASGAGSLSFKTKVQKAAFSPQGGEVDTSKNLTKQEKKRLRKERRRQMKKNKKKRGASLP